MESFVSLVYALFSFISTILMGKGKYISFVFGLIATLLYSFLAFKNDLWGSLCLSLFYYLPIESLSLYKWFKNTNSETKSIYKTKLKTKTFLLYITLAIFLSLILSYILFIKKDALPLLDGFITIFSILAAYLTLIRVIEQWIVWTVANILTFSMWVKLIFQGSNSIPVAILWGIYVVLGIKFYFNWKREINK